MKHLPALFLAALLAVTGRSAHALEVVATLPWIGDIAHRVAPDAHLTVLARGTEDPHHLSPTPALMAQVAKADLYLENGMNLELWSQRLLDGAGNPTIRQGQPGYVRVSEHVPRLEVPTELTRAKGDLHPDGNPHVWTDPLNAAIAADNIAAGLGRVDPPNAAAYNERAATFRVQVYERLFGADLVAFMGGPTLEKLARSGRLLEFLDSKGLAPRLGGWLGKAARSKKIVFYHQSWAYFVDRYGIEVVGYVEDRPGISPSASHKDQLAKAMKQGGCRTIAVTSYYNDRIAQALGTQVGAEVIIVPGDVGGVSAADDYFTFMDTLVDGLLQ